jgi:tetratricopeptide (TPR) repeat protein
MSRILVALMSIFFVYSLFAQSELKQLIRYGDELFDRGDYYYAKIYYEQALELDNKTISIQWKYAEILRAYQDYENAAIYYAKVFEKDKGYYYPYAGLFLGQMLQQNGDYRSAIQILEQVIDNPRNDKKSDLYLRAKQVLNACFWAIEHLPAQNDIEIKHMSQPINSDHAEFPHVIIGNRLIFSSLRTDSIELSEEVYSTNYRSRLFWGELGDNLSATLIDELVVQQYHLGNGAFNRDSTHFYFSMCTDGKQPYTCKIYFARYVSGKFSNIEVLSDVINFPGYNVTQPAIGFFNDKEHLFFVSNKDSRNGEMNLFYSIILDGNQFAKPKMLKNLNSIGNEISPFFDQNTKTLYFSSDFHVGYGGFDIFSSSWNGIDFERPINLGAPINSAANDNYYIKNSLGDTAFFASNRIGSYYAKNPTCCADIYMVSTSIVDIELANNTEEYPIEENSIPTSDKISSDVIHLPVLYFHNDIPNPKSWSRTTNLDYQMTFVDYLELRNTYQLNWASGKSDSLSALEEIDHLFSDFIFQGMEDLKLFRIWLLDRLQEGAQLEVVLRGFASPLTYTDYNVNLSKRRIQSFVNHLERFDNGVFKPYMDGTAKNGGRLIFVRMPFGEYAADQTVSDDRSDIQNSVYNPRAALERRIEVEAVRFLNQNDPNASVIIDKPTLDLGIVNSDQFVDFEFFVKLREQQAIEITEIKKSCDCLSIHSDKQVLFVGEAARFTGKFGPSKRAGHLVLPIEIVFSNGTSIKVFMNVEVRD